MIFIAIIFLIIFLTDSTSCSHFRFGTISWKPVDFNITDMTVQFTARWGWKRSYNAATYCDDNTISAGTLIGINSNIICKTGCYTVNEKIDTTTFICTQFSIADDWTMGEKIFKYSLPISSIIEASFTGGDWVPLNSGGKFSVMCKLMLIK